MFSAIASTFSNCFKIPELKSRILFTLLVLAMPPVLPLTIPFGVLVGILIGLGRMASDGEIVAMRAAGVPSRKVIVRL